MLAKKCVPYQEQQKNYIIKAINEITNDIEKRTWLNLIRMIKNISCKVA